MEFHPPGFLGPSSETSDETTASCLLFSGSLSSGLDLGGGEDDHEEVSGEA